ncbi:uncharacterized protein N7483_005430 [Penicillium malachiteum]|uniref:uncharacterized protein n=1 Tax=Penicillium malachiteum TaxID=1324776 RepID=UPI0025488038|nr:uncharacterized protein N7483_005430 [Penicillium malachiteum]KAJ5730922.1 hypothetical protein N7483_005430 [Penicillium malachiteum]
MRSLFPHKNEIQFSNGAALDDQTDLLGPGSPVSQVAGAWNSILTWWFPPDEEYQIRWSPSEEWIEVKVIRIAKRPDETRVTSTPVFMVRCYGGHPAAPQLGIPDTAMRQMTGSIRRMTASLRAKTSAKHAAIGSGNIVYLYEVDPDTAELRTSTESPGAYFLSASSPELQEFLDNVKLRFAKEWGHPYSRHCKDHFIELEDADSNNEGDEEVGEGEEEEEEEDGEESEGELSLQQSLYWEGGPRMHGYMSGRRVVRASPETEDN